MNRPAVAKEMSSDRFVINTYKRKWVFCNQTGNAFPVQKRGYWLSFLPFRPLSQYLERLHSEETPLYRISETTLAWTTGAVLKNLERAGRL